MALKFGKYLLEKQLAIGGMAEVFLAHQEGPAGFRKTLCIKRILPNFANDASFIEMFLDEARTAAQLSHPNIVQIYELGEIDEAYYIAMEYIRGPALSKVIRRLKQTNLSLPLHYAAKIISNICSGLEYAHTFTDSDGQPLNLVHRDISPDNVLVSFTGAVKMIDFGIAKAKTNQSKTQAGAVKGKFSYMSPEQIMGSNLDGRSDLFSLGIVLYELTTLRKPFGEDADLMTVSAIVNDPPPPPSELFEDYPPALQNVILRALAKDRRERFLTAMEMHQELERFIHEQGEFLTERDIGNYMTRLFSESEAEVDTLRQLGSGVRMKLTGVPVVKAPEDDGARVVDAAAVAPTNVGPLDRPSPGRSPAFDPDATRLVGARADNGADESTLAAPVVAAPRPVAKVNAPVPVAVPPTPETPVATEDAAAERGSGRGLLWAALGVVGVAALAAGAWFLFGDKGNTSEPTPTPAVVSAGKDAGRAARTDTAEAAPDAGATVAVVDAGAKSPKPDIKVAAADVTQPSDATAAADAGVQAVAGADSASQPDTTVAVAQDARLSADTTTVAAVADVAPVPDTSAADTSIAAVADAVAPAADVVQAQAVDAGGSQVAATGPSGADAGAEAADTAGVASAIQWGTVRVSSTPEMEVYWAGKRQGTTPLTLELPVGKHNLSLRGPGGLRKSTTAKVIADTKTSVSVSLEKGIISFEAPSGVAVYLNGKRLGQMPAVGRRDVWEGSYDVTFEHPDGRRIQKKIQISKSSPKVLVSHRF